MLAHIVTPGLIERRGNRGGTRYTLSIGQGSNQ